VSDLAAPLDAYRDVVRPEWIDHNGHMNMGYYLVVFDFATDEFFRWVGLDADHRRRHAITTFCLEAHVTYHREVRSGDPLRFTTVLLGHDAKRLHYIHAMYHAREGYLASTNELMSLHVDLRTRRGAPMAEEITARLAAIQAAHAALPRPSQAGRHVGFTQAPTTR
jgi:acyl-CoA thioester hydrolase